MIIDLERFIAEERGYWNELEALLDDMRADTAYRMDLAEAKRLHYLYGRASSDLAKLMTFASEPELRTYLESLVARAYGEIHEVRDNPYRFAPIRWVSTTLPTTFRRQIWAFKLSVLITLVGCLFGGLVVLNPELKETLLPFPHLRIDPSQRVEQERKAFLEESGDSDPLEGHKAMGTSFYITHNTKVAITTLALGISWGIGTIIILFSNGVLLGAVCIDYIRAGEAVFLTGWLLPHGATEIPAILIAGQGGILLGSALIGWGSRLPVKARLRRITSDLVTLIGGAALLLVWAGFVEAFLSQYHFVVPFWVKIGLGVVELSLLILFLALAGRKSGGKEREAHARQ